MRYAVLGSAFQPDVGTVFDERDTITEAVVYARELLRLGMKGVKIRYPDGGAYGPAVFDRLTRKVEGDNTHRT